MARCHVCGAEALVDERAIRAEMERRVDLWLAARGLEMSLREWRLRAELTMEQLAKRASLTYGVVKNAEYGRPVSTGALLRMADALGIVPSHIAEYRARVRRGLS